MRVKQENLLDSSGPISLAADAELRPIWLGHIAYYSIQLVFTGTPDGVFKLQASNDAGSITSAGAAQQVSGIEHWTDIGSSSATISAAGDQMWTVENAGYAWVRVVWIASSAGTTPVLSSAKAYVKGV